MKASTFLTIFTATTAAALSITREQQAVLQDQRVSEPELYLIELSPGETQWVTEDEKWEIRRVGLRPRLMQHIKTRLPTVACGSRLLFSADRFSARPQLHGCHRYPGSWPLHRFDHPA